ncbi:hypothetical protein B0H14DRAFT_1240041 [Mycena olivaceomarginata]|nr:hypothetical protein B0H14DRAFT_1240041 [Mycena olivaceomarginata]
MHAHPPPSTTIPVLCVLPLVLPRFFEHSLVPKKYLLACNITSPGSPNYLDRGRYGAYIDETPGTLFTRPRCYLDGRPLWTRLRWWCS